MPGWHLSTQYEWASSLGEDAAERDPGSGRKAERRYRQWAVATRKESFHRTGDPRTEQMARLGALERQEQSQDRPDQAPHQRSSSLHEKSWRNLNGQVPSASTADSAALPHVTLTCCKFNCAAARMDDARRAKHDMHTCFLFAQQRTPLLSTVHLLRSLEAEC